MKKKELQDDEGVIHRGPRMRWKKPSEISRIFHIVQKPNSIIIIALLFIQSIFFAKIVNQLAAISLFVK